MREGEETAEAGSGESWSVLGVLHVVWFGTKMVSKRDIEGSKGERKSIWHWPYLYALKDLRQDNH